MPCKHGVVQILATCSSVPWSEFQNRNFPLPRNKFPDGFAARIFYEKRVRKLCSVISLITFGTSADGFFSRKAPHFHHDLEMLLNATFYRDLAAARKWAYPYPISEALDTSSTYFRAIGVMMKYRNRGLWNPPGPPDTWALVLRNLFGENSLTCGHVFKQILFLRLLTICGGDRME